MADLLLYSLQRQVAETFFLHGGLEYLTTDRLLPTFGATSREFRKRARQEFNHRLKLCHPSLAAAAGRDIDRISWRDWRRFELGESDSRGTGESWQVTVENLADIDVLWEVTKKDGQIVWHGFAPLRRGEPSRRSNPRFNDSPKASFNLPRTIFDAPIPTADDDSKFESPSPRFHGLTDYHYWSGRDDCSLQQRTICKLLYGINIYPLLHIHAVMRRRSNGKMITLMSANKPNQIIGEDYGDDVGEYYAYYVNSESIYDDDDRLDVEIGFELFCSEEVDETQECIQFRTNRVIEKQLDGGETAGLCFKICEQNDNDDAESLILQAMSSWKWD